ncbi:MAG TPA: succinate dehydrogenase/fumarate reductase iron-sulfur subunit [Thermoplasmata archaeon]
MRLKIWRSEKDGKNGRYDVFEISPKPGMTVLEALFEIQDAEDDSLGFRFACRGAICGSCAMMINREMRLACRTQVAGLDESRSLGLKMFPALQRPPSLAPTGEILVEPLPNLPILKDLIVDMTRFYETYRRIRPWIEPEASRSEFSKMSQEDCAKVEKYGNCILCAACFGSCPVCERDLQYVGPHALAWAYRFIEDPRVGDEDTRMEIVSEDNGAPACDFVYNCVKVCPKDVSPAGAIRRLRDMIEKTKGHAGRPRSQ